MVWESHKFRAEVGWLFCRGITVSDSSVDAPASPSSPKELKSQGVKCFDWSSRRFGKDHRVFPRLLWGSYSAGISMVLWLAWDQVYKVGLSTLLKEVLWYFFPRGLAESFDKHRPMEKLNRTESGAVPFCTHPSHLECRAESLQMRVLGTIGRLFLHCSWLNRKSP